MSHKKDASLRLYLLNGLNYSLTVQAPVTQSRFQPRITTIHPDLSQMVKSGCVGMGKKRKSSINTVSHDAPTVSARFIYGSTTTYDGSATIHHGGATNAHDASMIRLDASTIQAGSAMVASPPPTNLHDLVVVMRQYQKGGGWGWGCSHFSSYVDSGQASIVQPPPPPKKKKKKTKKKNRNFKNPPK